MRERPILFLGEMVRALLARTKTQTRRVWKLPRGCQWYPELGGESEGWVIDPGQPWWLHVDEFHCPYGRQGDRLWVRETFYAWGRWETRYSAKKGRDEWHFLDMTLECAKAYQYGGDHPQPLAVARDGGATPKWWKRPAIHMPRAASRMLLEITDARAERLQDISEADGKAEGCRCNKDTLAEAGFATYRAAYAHLWDQINGPGSWEANPWVWVVEFKRLP